MSAAMLPKALPAASEDAEEIARMQRLFERQRLAFEAAPYPERAARKAGCAG